MLRYLGVDSKDTLAFGEGHKDIEMFRAVAMGITSEELKSIADGVTTGLEEDGIAKGLNKYLFQ